MHSLHKICHCRNIQWNRKELDASEFFHRNLFGKEISTFFFAKITVNFTASQTHYSENEISSINFLFDVAMENVLCLFDVSYDEILHRSHR